MFAVTRLQPSRRTVNRAGVIFGTFTLLLSALMLLCPGRLVLQARSEHSVPFTIGLRLAAPPAWSLGQLVQFRSRDLAPYYPRGLAFTKAVAALPGDCLARLDHTFYVNDHAVGTALSTDSLGRPAPLYDPLEPGATPCQMTVTTATGSRLLPGAVIPADALFVLGAHERSFDSRYWGLVRAPEVIGRVVVVF